MPQEPSDFYETFKSLMFKTDIETDVKEKSRAIREKKERFKDVSASLKTADDWIRFGAVQRALMAETIDQPVPFFPFATSEEACRRLEMEHDNITRQYAGLNIERAENLLKSSRKRRTTYLDRHRHAENAIRMIYELLEDDDQWRHVDVTWPGRENESADKAAYRFIAESYLHRSRLALPKGESIPEKKLEALDNAWSWARKASDEPDELKAEIVLEQLRWNSNFSGRKAGERLLSFVGYIEQKRQAMDEKRPLHQKANDALQALDETLGILETRDSFREYDKKLLAPDQKARPHQWLALLQARAALRLERSDLDQWLGRAVDALDRGKTALSLTSPLWNDTVETIGRAAKCKKFKGQWEAAALKAWDICRKAERSLRLSVQIRRHWSRQKSLYDLAFQAAVENDPEKAVEIADGQKSRPAMKILDMERSLEGADLTALKRRLEIDAMDFEDVFIVGMDDWKRENPPDEEPPPETGPRPITAVPKGWAAVHFYIVDPDNMIEREDDNDGRDHNKIPKAWAMVVKKVNHDGALKDVCTSMAVDIESLGRAHLHWEAERRARDIDAAIDPVLTRVLETAGDMLQPVLEAVGDENVIFIPHGFLHLAPLHAAVVSHGAENGEDGADRGRTDAGPTHLFERKRCLFLPAWSLPRGEPATPNTEGAAILNSNLEKSWMRDLIDKEWSNKKYTGNTPGEVITSLERAPSPNLFALFCHGQGDVVNPYNARFLLKDGMLTYRDIKNDMPGLNGARVVLTACETDLVSGAGLTDEHLSLAAAFFEAGASEVAGTLFKCNPAIAREFLLEAKEQSDRPLHEILGKVQTKHKGRAHMFTPFRVMGFPTEKETAND